MSEEARAAAPEEMRADAEGAPPSTMDMGANKEAEGADAARGKGAKPANPARGSYKCGLCGMPKKGHGTTTPNPAAQPCRQQPTRKRLTRARRNSTRTHTRGGSVPDEGRGAVQRTHARRHDLEGAQ